MQTLDKKKLNLLVHLAKVDGKFVSSEKMLLHEFLKEKGLDERQLMEEEFPVKFSDFSRDHEKTELLYWAIRLIQADNIIHPKELLFCKNLAYKLNFDTRVVDEYASRALPPLSDFEQAVNKSFMQ